MKITRCSIYQFGKLKEREFSFQDGFTLIEGKNESGKTTLHTALAAFLFGAEKGRGKAAAAGIYKSNLPWVHPELYGGAIDWERGGSRIHMERDFAKVPPRAYITRTQDGITREAGAADLPWPASFSPYLYFNTLSFRQIGSGVESGMADELRSHIVNLQGSGDESIDMAAALLSLRAKKRALSKQLDPQADLRLQEVEQQLKVLEAESFTDEENSWDSTRSELSEEENRSKELARERGTLLQDISRRETLLKNRGIEDPEKLKEDAEKAHVLAEQMKNYQETYRPKALSGGAIRTISLVTIPFLLLFFWIVVNRLQAQDYTAAAIYGALLFCAMFISTRFSRKEDAVDAYKHNQKALDYLLKEYMPDYESEGTPEEAAELAEYMDKLLGLLKDLDGQREALDDCTRELGEQSGREQSLGRRLEAQMNAQVRRENWEADIAALMDRREQLQAIVQENVRLREEIQALDLASETLMKLATDVYSHFGAPLTESASDIFREVTDGRYEGVRINDKLEIYAVQNHQLVAPGALSAGTMEQLYFAFRLAVIRLLWPDEAMPLFFDDSFAFYDSDRLLSLLAWLRDNYKGQVFLFTCQNREEQMLQKLGISYQKIEL